MNCDCHCNGKCQLLGGLEQKIMEVLWASSVPLKPAAVQAQMSEPYAYTTIMTVLKRMTDKKLVKRVLEGNVYTYVAAISKADFATSSLSDLFERIFHSYGDFARSAFDKVSKKHS
jgi:predicted transcriptional regulator